MTLTGANNLTTSPADPSVSRLSTPKHPDPKHPDPKHPDPEHPAPEHLDPKHPDPELCARIERIYLTLAGFPDLEPSPEVNSAFSDLVLACEHQAGRDVEQVLAAPRIVALTADLRQRCATGEYLLERHWARRILAAADPDAELAQFPYLSNYEQLTRLELHALAGVGFDPGRWRRVCFLGGGPLPLSAAILSRTLSVPIDVVDISVEATTLAEQVLSRVSGAGTVHVHHADAADFGAVHDSDVVILAGLVGLERSVKHQVLTALAARMPSGGLLIARSAHGLRTLLYPPLDLSDLHDWQPLSVVHPMNAVVNSVVTAIRR